jgi:NADH-quinone oxidoreductase subunit N
MFTLMGLPPTAGFWGKLALFGSALAAAKNPPLAVHSTALIALVVIALLNSALAAAYYLRVIAAVLLYDNDQPASSLTREAPRTGVLLCGLLLAVFAIYPGALLSAGKAATTEFESVANIPPHEFPPAAFSDADNLLRPPPVQAPSVAASADKSVEHVDGVPLDLARMTPE